MSLYCFNPHDISQPESHDFLAVLDGKIYSKLSKYVR